MARTGRALASGRGEHRGHMLLVCLPAHRSLCSPSCQCDRNVAMCFALSTPAMAGTPMEVSRTSVATYMASQLTK